MIVLEMYITKNVVAEPQLIASQHQDFSLKYPNRTESLRISHCP